MKKTSFLTLEKAKEIIDQIPTPFHLYDEAGIRQFLKARDGEHAVDVLVNVGVVVTTVCYHQLVLCGLVRDLSPCEVSSQVESLLILSVYAGSCCESNCHLAERLCYRSPNWLRSDRYEYLRL